MKKTAAGIFVATWLMVIAAASADDYTGQIIQDVRIEGLELVGEKLVRSQIEVKPGQEYASHAIARDIRRLYELGHFSNVEADIASSPAGLVLTYRVKEKQFIDEIAIIGNKKVKDRHIRAVLSWREGDSFVPEAYDDEREEILRLYRSKGFPNASVEIIVEELGRSRVRITYQIDEGRKARIKDISFTGNEALSQRKLRKLMQTKRSKWFLGGKYDEDVFAADLDALVDEYWNHGRLEAQVQGTDFDYAEKGKGVRIAIHLSEGPEYSVESLETANDDEYLVFDEDEILRTLKVQAGDIHNQDQIEKDAQQIQQGHETSGYVNSHVVPQVTLDREKKTTHLVYRIHEGDLKYIKEIKITGNSVTRDEVIRREALAIPGERFDGGLLKASQRRMENTEYFDQVRFTLEELEDTDEFANLLIDVDEGRTGNFNFGAGYSTEDKFGGFAELKLNNFDITNWPKFSGAGQQFRLKLHLGDRRTEYNLSFTDPEIAGWPLAFGFDLFDDSYDYSGGSNYSEEKTGAQIRFGKMLSPYVTLRTAILYTDTRITGVPFWTWIFYPEYYGDQQEGSTTISSIWGISRNTLDSNRDPSRGSKHDVQLQLAGLGGDNHFYKLEHDSTWYWALGEEEKWVLSYRTREGWANEYGSSDFVPIQDRLFAGGTSTVRGYDSRDIGPKAAGLFGLGEKQAIGGELRIVENLELKYKLTKQLRFYTFLDAGGVWETTSDFGLGDIKYGAGVGFGVDIPHMGPVRVDYGIPLNPDSDQGSGRLHLQTGFRF